ncbi:MAG: NADH-quinone oxidoreductase subunit NuoN [Rhodospirillaceae bacterium]|nr:MAG: NADH-quinone oxidoreductase subunit NuoN [Rhodospirillaceae bacterium]
MLANLYPDLFLALPEIFLACAAMTLLMVGVFQKQASTGGILIAAVLALVVALVLVPYTMGDRATAFGGLYISDSFSAFMKTMVLLGTALTLVMAHNYNEREGFARFEYPVLVLFAAVGMLMMLSANDLLSLYMGLELQSLSLYVLAAIRRDSLRSTEAGLKYFILGALASGMLLYGASMIYGFTGTTNFDVLAAQLIDTNGAAPSLGVIVGIVFLLAGLAFKISAVPFHMWTPDVYEGAPTPVTAFFSVAPKIAAIGLLLRVLTGPFESLILQWQQIIIVVSIASMVLGAFSAINQTNIKRLMAYSSIGHVGFALLGLAAGTEAGIRGVLVYMAIYLFMSVGTFCCILCMRKKGRITEEISDLAGLAKTNPGLALAMAIFMFSMAGIPPLAGFFGKLYVFLAAIEAELYTLAVIGVLASVVGAYYYLRIVRVMYFEEPLEGLDRSIGREMLLILSGTAVITLFFFAYPGPILDVAAVAAAALFAG